MFKIKDMICYCVIAVMILASAVSATPVFPHNFYGSLSINEEPAPVGTQVRAMIGGSDATVAAYATETEGIYGSISMSADQFKVLGDADGQQITFQVYYNGQWRDTEENALYASGGNTDLDLTLIYTGCSSDAECDDGIFCNGEEVCSAGVCTDGTPVVCDNGLFCDGLETCDETADACTPGTPISCDDGLFCNGEETCNEDTDTCAAGTAVDCSNGLFCDGDETCNEDTDSCDAGVAVVCDNGLYCDGTETCDETADACAPGTPVDCSNGIYCDGEETCDESSNLCVAGTPVTCDDSLYCNGLETCDEDADACAPGTPVDCSNGLYCDGLETCNEETDTCDAGISVVCDDSDICTDDSCNEETDSCQYVFDATNDPICTIYEDCTNGLDDDEDGYVDCDDTDCYYHYTCGGVEEVCNDGLDNDADSLVDCLDSDCDTFSGCEYGVELSCNDGIDNDGDGNVDCLDPDCQSTEICCADNYYTITLYEGWNLISLALEPTYPVTGYTADSLCDSIVGCDTVAWLDAETQVMHDNVGPEDTSIVGGAGYYVHVDAQTEFGVCGIAWS